MELSRRGMLLRLLAAAGGAFCAGFAAFRPAGQRRQVRAAPPPFYPGPAAKLDNGSIKKTSIWAG